MGQNENKDQREQTPNFFVVEIFESQNITFSLRISAQKWDKTRRETRGSKHPEE